MTRDELEQAIAACKQRAQQAYNEWQANTGAAQAYQHVLDSLPVDEQPAQEKQPGK